jgi:hypothetical protein
MLMMADLTSAAVFAQEHPGTVSITLFLSM